MEELTMVVPTQSSHKPLLLRERDAIEVLAISRSAFRKLMTVGAVRPIYFGRSIRFVFSDIERLVEEKRSRPSRGAGDGNG
jgi:predicted DNA-binding transcriptional regulator AlpA